jgi:nicotinate phosphoribosyltransferase
MELVYRGPWYYTILWEVPLMALLSETYFQFSGDKPLSDEVNHSNNVSQAKSLRGIPFADFGTRRRYSEANHAKVLEDILSVPDNSLVGTSNVRFAKQFGLKPIGTMAHEWIMFHGAINGYPRANYSALEAWTQVYRGDLGIALTDTFTTDVFLRTFDTYHAKLFDGVRHDSGDPFRFASKVIRHYEDLGIDPKTKTIVFSDSLNPSTVRQIHQYCHNRIRASFGIGTCLTNSVGVKPLNMVIKMTKAKLTEDSPWVPTVKLSDFETKHTGDPEQVELCKRVLGV